MNLRPTPTIDVLHDDTVSALVLKCSVERGSESVKGWKMSDGIEDRSRRGHVSTRTRLKSAVCFFPFSFLSSLFSFIFLYVVICVLLIF